MLPCLKGLDDGPHACPRAGYQGEGSAVDRKTEKLVTCSLVCSGNTPTQRRGRSSGGVEGGGVHSIPFQQINRVLFASGTGDVTHLFGFGAGNPRKL